MDHNPAPPPGHHRPWWPIANPPMPTSPPPPSLWPHHHQSVPTSLHPGTPSPSSPPLPTTDTSPGALRALLEHHPHPHPLRPLYLGIFLSGPSRQTILHKCHPIHATVYSHHITLHYFGYDSTNIGADVELCCSLPVPPLGSEVAVRVDGVLSSDRVQTLAVTLPSYVRPSSSSPLSPSPSPSPSPPPHITVSIVEGGAAQEAGNLLRDVFCRYRRDHRQRNKNKKKSSTTAPPLPIAIEPVNGLRVVHGVVGVCLSDRTVVYSEEDLRECVLWGNDDASEGIDEDIKNQDTEIEAKTESGEELVDLVGLMKQFFVVENVVDDLSTKEEQRQCSAPSWDTRMILTPSVQLKDTINIDIDKEATPCFPTTSSIDIDRTNGGDARLPPLPTRKNDSHGHHHRRHGIRTNSTAVSFLQEQNRQKDSEAAFILNNAHLLTVKLDLHGMYTTEALATMNRYIHALELLKHPGGILLKMVTGHGKHSKDNRARILPAVVAALSERNGHVFDLDAENPGVVRVLIE